MRIGVVTFPGTLDDYDAARRTAHRARRQIMALFADVDVILAPGAPGAAPAGLASTGDPVFNRLWTLLGLPAVAVPGLVDSENRPLGVQVIAPFGHDDMALSAAQFVENLLKQP